jgi:hypothetical protein
MRDERGQRGGGDAFRRLFEHKRDVDRMLPFDVNGQMSGGGVCADSGRVRLVHLLW